MNPTATTAASPKKGPAFRNIEKAAPGFSVKRKVRIPGMTTCGSSRNAIAAHRFVSMSIVTTSAATP